MRSIASILLAGSAFCFSASTAIGPLGSTTTESRRFYLPYQYSSFADDTALYADAYRDAGGLTGGGEEAGRTVGDVPGRGGEDGRIMAGIISHHLFIRNLIAQYFTQLARCVHPGTIVVIGPNHHARGHSPIALSALRWRTPFGFVEPDSGILMRISASGFATVEEEPFVNEHSIGALVPFIRRSFPGSRIVPVIFTKAANRQDCLKLAGILSNLPEGTLVLASLDFSHYKTSREAEREDEASLGVLRSLSTDRVDEACVDSRPAMLTLMQLCRNIGATDVDVLQHTNSGILSHNPSAACTSYINACIRKQGRQD